MTCLTSACPRSSPPPPTTPQCSGVAVAELIKATLRKSHFRVALTEKKLRITEGHSPSLPTVLSKFFLFALHLNPLFFHEDMDSPLRTFLICLLVASASSTISDNDFRSDMQTGGHSEQEVSGAHSGKSPVLASRGRRQAQQNPALSAPLPVSAVLRAHAPNLDLSQIVVSVDIDRSVHYYSHKVSRD